ncbi:PBS lyase HEAT-like repeat protein [Thioploca ingrica]|uniref:PBS lyase HEAT-like repeat protein n=1 Tax=Thioploca ingrica TaxID=40754 RepID=A0A090AJE5_9GAMM|nr:PBS lyase HEAT-like repeat protein [Thioploca ingrica]
MKSAFVVASSNGAEWFESGEEIFDEMTATVFVIAMREDFALELNAFKLELSTLLFENFYQLEKLTIENAKQAMVASVARLGFTYEAGLYAVVGNGEK